jgi:hypothetical protein
MVMGINTAMVHTIAIIKKHNLFFWYYSILFSVTECGEAMDKLK